MRHTILFFICFPFLVLSQQQVSDVQFDGVLDVSNTTINVGFAKVEGVNYMLQEKDSLKIYQWENEEFELIHIIESLDCQRRIGNYISPNRSLFEIHDGKYFRILENGIQIIDIASGQIDFEYSGVNDEFGLMSPREIFNNKYYFRGLKNELWDNYVLSFSTSDVVFIPLPNRSYYRQVGDILLGVESDTDVFALNGMTGKEELLLVADEGVRFIDFSVQDSTFVVVEKNGVINKFSYSLEAIPVSCVLPNVNDLRRIKVKGNRLIAIYNHTFVQKRKDRIVIYNLNSCSEELNFITDEIESFAGGIQFVANEAYDDEFTIFGFYGQHPSDGFDQGLYYLIDHNTNQFKAYHDLSGIRAHTPFVYNDKVFFVAYNSSFWFGQNEFILSYNFEDQSFEEFNPHGYDAKYATLGFEEGDEIFNVLNTIEEDPHVWLLSEEGGFKDVQRIEFLYNLGVHYVFNEIALEDRIYFTTNGGIYSVFEDDRTEYTFDQESPIQSYNPGAPLSYYSDKISFSLSTPDQTLFKVLDINTGEVETFVDPQFTSSSIINAAGPFHFYSSGSFESELKIFDSKSGEIIVFPDIPFIISSWLIPGDQSAIFLYDPFSNQGPPPVYKIDFITNEIIELDIELFRWYNILPGANNSFYFIDRESGIDNTRVRLLTENGEFTEIFNGPGRFFTNYFAHSENSDVSFIGLRGNDDNAIVIANDLNKTEIIEVDHISSNGSVELFYGNAKDKLVLQVNGLSGLQYWNYNAFGILEEIDNGPNGNIQFADMTDSLLVSIYYSESDQWSVFKHDFENNQTTNIILENACDFFNISRGIKINEHEYLLSVHCIEGYEPWILDVRDNSLRLLKDMAPGRMSSSPSNFILFKEWVYFTATLKDGSRQWFRLSTKLSTNTFDIVEKVNEFITYPSPATNSISLDRDIREMLIYDMNGKLVYSQGDYRKRSIIEIGFLTSGSYVIFGKDDNDIMFQGRFIKIKP